METLGIILKGKNSGVFKNDNGEYCQISRYYIGNNHKFQIIFSKGLGDIAMRGAINTTSEKKVLKLIKDEKFVLDI
jgi:hypothetical protein